MPLPRGEKNKKDKAKKAALFGYQKVFKREGSYGWGWELIPWVDTSRIEFETQEQNFQKVNDLANSVIVYEKFFEQLCANDILAMPTCAFTKLARLK